MQLLVASLVGAVVLLAFPGVAAAQCEGGLTVGGYYLPGGTYVSGGCAFTNPTTPGQLYPSGASPTLSTNPAQAGSRLPGQQQPADLIPVNSSDLGPAPSLVNVPQPALGPQRSGPSVGPGVPVASALPAEFPPSGTPALTGNRAMPSTVVAPGHVGGLPGVVPSLSNTAYSNDSLPPAPPPADEPGLPPAPARGGPATDGEEPAELIFITY